MARASGGRTRRGSIPHGLRCSGHGRSDRLRRHRPTPVDLGRQVVSAVGNVAKDVVALVIIIIVVVVVIVTVHQLVGAIV